jgi:hypothetical protein
MYLKFKLAPLILFFVSSAAIAEEFNGQKLTMKNGRVLEGIYDAEKGKLEIIGETGSRLPWAVKAEDIAKVENVVLHVQIITKADQELKRRRLERTGTELNLKRVSEQLAAFSVSPLVMIAQYKKRIPEVQEILKKTATTAVEMRKNRDDYGRQVALRESSTTTTKVTDTETKVDVVTDGDATTHVYGDAWWTSYRERTSGWGSKHEVTNVTVDVTADAARAELTKFNQEVSNIEAAVKEMSSYIRFLEKEIAVQEKHIVTIETLTKEKARWDQRLVELNKIIDGKP